MTFHSDSHKRHTSVTPRWESIAEEVSREQGPKKLTELVAELNRALDEQQLKLVPKPNPDGTRSLDSK
jgi:hypothetical protein